MPQDLNPETLSIHMDSLRRAARGMTRSHHDAEDLVQDMLVKVLARPRQIGPAGEAAYLHQALRNTHISRLRTKDRRPQLAPLEPEDTRLVAPAHSEPVEVIHTREILAQIHQLPTAQREVIAAVDVAGLAYTEAADVLQIPVGTVMSRLHRGRAKLQAGYATAA
ncbi:RNA polymerase sigma factor [Solirubrobacter taibaiensis]|nr:RNA polymerase sigma factor [Solirubrobacter taibaiensis]